MQPHVHTKAFKKIAQSIKNHERLNRTQGHHSCELKAFISYRQPLLNSQPHLHNAPNPISHITPTRDMTDE